MATPDGNTPTWKTWETLKAAKAMKTHSHGSNTAAPFISLQFLQISCSWVVSLMLLHDRGNILNSKRCKNNRTLGRKVVLLQYAKLDVFLPISSVHSICSYSEFLLLFLIGNLKQTCVNNAISAKGNYFWRTFFYN